MNPLERKGIDPALFTPGTTTRRWLRWLLLVCCVALVTYCLPRDSERRYLYEENRPWNHSLLTAPFDIPIQLDSVSAQHVRDSIESRFEPVYTRDLTAEKLSVADFAKQLEKNRGDLTPGECNRLVAQLRNIYDIGITDRNTANDIRSGKITNVRMIHDNVAYSVPAGNYMSVRGAYEALDSAFSDPRFHRAIAGTSLAELLRPNILLDTLTTEKMRNDAIQRALAPVGVVVQGERIIDRGEVVNKRLYTILRTYETMLAERGGQTIVDSYYPLAGKAAYLLLLFGSLYVFLYFFRRDYFDDTRVMLFVMLLVTGCVLVGLGMASAFASGMYLVPFTVVPIIVQVFLDSRTAFLSYLITVMTVLVVAVFPLEFVFMQWVAGVAATCSIKELSKRSDLIRTALLVFAAYSCSYVAVELLLNGSMANVNPKMFGYFGVNALFISFAYILVFVLEKVFGFTSRVTLVELSDINNPVLRELSEECPGTFQHSMAVSNLATAAAVRIGANVQMVRTGALYHDIGKLGNPAFFTENQHGVNPHDALDPLQSARIVIGHVPDGLRRAEKAKLPTVIRRFISEHHGRGTAKYFYTTYCNAHPGVEVDPAPFTYPGPNPTSRETSVVMMADAVEAASRSLSDHSPEAIANLVNRIVDSQVADGLHNESPISFRDITTIKNTFISRLRTMYHSRIAYPEAKKQGQEGVPQVRVIEPEDRNTEASKQTDHPDDKTTDDPANKTDN